ncbi:MAG: glycosyltransferase family 2 protein [Rikenellaceae bacterium]|nr:glycosyltransferase family 2 protein [Rikenellaceae bacterium]
MLKAKIVILNWNGRQHLETYLPSVVASCPDWAGVVVADNGSTDDSVEWLVAHYPQVELVLLDRNYGFAEGYNRALAQVEDAEYLVLLNSDVETPEGWLTPLVECLESDPRVGAVAPKLRSWCDRTSFEYAGASGGFMDVLGYPFCRGRIMGTIEKDCGQYDDARNVFWASGAAFACRSSVFRSLGGFDGDFFAHQEEIDLCWRMWRAGYTVRVEPRSVVYHLGGGTLPTSSPRKTYLNHRNNLSMLYKNLNSPIRRTLVVGVRLVLDGLTAAMYLCKGEWQGVKAVWQAHRDFFARRRSLRAKRTPSIASPEGVYRGSMVLRYLFGGRTFNQMM